MILLPCAWCGPRDAAEFQHAGEVVTRPDPRTATPAQWRAYLYLRANPCGWTVETWYHRMGCRRFFKVERHTETNEVRPVATAEVPGAATAGVAGTAGVTGAMSAAGTSAAGTAAVGVAGVTGATGAAGTSAAGTDAAGVTGAAGVGAAGTAGAAGSAGASG